MKDRKKELIEDLVDTLAWALFFESLNNPSRVVDRIRSNIARGILTKDAAEELYDYFIKNCYRNIMITSTEMSKKIRRHKRDMWKIINRANEMEETNG